MKAIKQARKESNQTNCKNTAKKKAKKQIERILPNKEVGKQTSKLHQCL